MYRPGHSNEGAAAVAACFAFAGVAGVPRGAEIYRQVEPSAFFSPSQSASRGHAEGSTQGEKEAKSHQMLAVEAAREGRRAKEYQTHRR